MLKIPLSLLLPPSPVPVTQHSLQQQEQMFTCAALHRYGRPGGYLWALLLHS